LRLLLHLGRILIGKRKKEKKKRAALYVANDETPTFDFAMSRNRLAAFQVGHRQTIFILRH